MATDRPSTGPSLLGIPEELEARESLLALSSFLEAVLRDTLWLHRVHDVSVLGRLGNEKLRLRTVSFRGGSLRWVRHVELVGDQGTLALNTCCFPKATSPLPLWSSEILALRDRLHLVALDVLPCHPAQEFACRELLLQSRKWMSVSEVPSVMPPWAQAISSPWALFLRRPTLLPSTEHLNLGVQQAIDQFLQMAAVSNSDDKVDLTSQRLFIAAMSANDPAVAYLGRAFGASWARQYCEEILFPPC